MLPIKRVSAWIPALAGLCLLLLAARTGVFAFLLIALPGSLLLAGGVRALLAPDLRAPQHIAIGSVFGLLLAIPVGLAGGAVLACVTVASCAIAFLAGGWLEIRLQPVLEDVPAPAAAPAYSALVALDDAVLSFMNLLSPMPRSDALRVAVRESETAHALFSERGWITAPETFHQAPPEIRSVQSSPLRVRGIDCEHLRFESGYEPEPGIPGRERWLAYAENRTSHALVLRHKEPGPWLVCVHGFGMGKPAQDVQAFRARQLHERAGLNVALFVLPVHGPRAPGRVNGEKFFGLSVLDFIHAEAQAVWDLRRLIAWVRKQEASRIGVYGISLGGYTSAVLAGLEDGLACVIAGIPPADMIATTEHLASSFERRISAAAGVDHKRDRDLYRVVSPLALSPRVERNRRFMFAATADQFVPIEQIRALWLHWERPRISWSTGGHLGALLQREPRRLVDEAIAATFGPGAGSPGGAVGHPLP